MADNTVTATKEDVAKMLETMPHVNIKKPIFLIFAEFLGYASPVVHWAEEICKNPNIPKFKRHIVDMDAVVIFEKMKQEFGLEYIKECWVNLYPVILEEYDTALKEIDADDLPF